MSESTAIRSLIATALGAAFLLFLIGRPHHILAQEVARSQNGEDRTVSRFHHPSQVMLDMLAGDAWHGNSERTRVKVCRRTE